MLAKAETIASQSLLGSSSSCWTEKELEFTPFEYGPSPEMKLMVVAAKTSGAAQPY